MKIGELAKNCGVSKATIRFYMGNGLLIPNEDGGNYSFSEQDRDDLQTILRMKEQQFSLKEIQSYISLKRMSNLIEPDTIDECLRIMENKKLELNAKIEILQRAILGIDKQIVTLTSQSFGSPQRTGLPIRALPLLRCPLCGKPLLVDSAVLDSQYIFSGSLNCSCGYHAAIRNGIIRTGNRYTGTHDQPNLRRELYRNMGSKYNICIQKCYNHMASDLNDMELSGKVVLEANINGHFYLYSHFEQFPDDCLFIVTDKYYEMLEMYKSLIELLNLKKNILYIADADSQYPLRFGCIDLHISFMGENEYQFYHQANFIQNINQWMKTGAVVIGSYMSYAPGSQSFDKVRKKYPECSSNGFNIKKLRENYIAEGYQPQIIAIGQLEKTVNRFCFECHVDGEPLFINYFQAHRKRCKQFEQVEPDIDPAF